MEVKWVLGQVNWRMS